MALADRDFSRKGGRFLGADFSLLRKLPLNYLVAIKEIKFTYHDGVINKVSPI